MAWSLFPRKRPTVSITTLDLVLIFALMALFYADPLLSATRMPYGGDGMSLFLPAFEHYRQAVYNGTIPLWNSGTWLGAPFLAAFQAMVLYPPQLLALVPATAVVAQNLSVFFSLLWLAWGAYIFGLRALQLERFASLLMAIAMGCSGFVGGHIEHVNQLAAISWIPWIMSEALILLRRPRLKGCALLAAFLGMQVLAGHPQYVAYTLAYLAGLVLCYSVYYYHRRKADSAPAWSGMVLVALSIVVGVGLGMAQLLPSVELAERSIRRTDSPDRMLSYSFPPKHLLTLLLPDAYGNPATGLHPAFSMEVDLQLKMEDILDWPGLCATLNREQSLGRPGPGRRIWEFLDDETRRTLEDGAVEGIGLEREAKLRTVKAINAVLSETELYRAEDFARIVSNSDAREYLARNSDALKGKGIRRFNRLLLEAAYPNLIAKGHWGYDYNYGEFICYTGIAVLALALLAVATLIRLFIVRTFVVLALVSLVVAFGSYAGNGAPYQFVMMWFPGGDGFRVPARFLIFFLLSISVLAAVGFNQASHYLTVRRRLSHGFLLSIFACILSVTFVDLYLFSRRQAFRFHGSTDVLEERGNILAHLEKDHLDYRIFRLMDEVQYDLEDKRFVENRLLKKFGARLQVQRVQPNLHMLWELQACHGYEEGLLPPLNYRTFMGYDLPRHLMGRFTRNLHSAAPDTVLLGLLNVKYVLTDKPIAGNRLKFVTQMLFRPSNTQEQKIFEKLPDVFLHFALYENLDYLPKFLWGHRLRAVCDLEKLDVKPDAAESMISMDERKTNLTYRRIDEISGETLLSTASLASESVVSTASLWSRVVKDEAFTIQRPEGNPNAFFVKKSAGEAGEILFLEAPYPGWVCRWEGGEAPLERVNAIMMGCQAPLEADLFEFVYEPFSFRFGLFLSCCFVLLLATVVCFLRFPEQRRTAAESADAQ